MFLSDLPDISRHRITVASLPLRVRLRSILINRPDVSLPVESMSTHSLTLTGRFAFRIANRLATRPGNDNDIYPTK